MPSGKARYIYQASHPDGFPVPGNFTVAEEAMPAVAPGTALVENIYLSVDPYMRQLMDGGWDLLTPLEGRSIGRVVDSKEALLPVGKLVFHRQGWRTHALVTASQVQILPDVNGVPVSVYLSVLGGTGLSAYVGLTKIARLQKGESIFVSAAAGGVGTAVGQIARMLGAGRLIGSTGSSAKVRHLIDDLGFDAAFDYHDGPVSARLAEAAPDGIDVYFDNVGGEHLEAAIEHMRDHGRIAWCGAIAQYHGTAPPCAPRNLFDIAEKSIRLEGFLVRDYNSLNEELRHFLTPHIQSGELIPDETIIQGFDRAVDAFLGMLSGENTGKMIVQVTR